MLNYSIVVLSLFWSISIFAQQDLGKKKEKVLKELSVQSCDCIDSISTFNKSSEQIAEEINSCISAKAGAYQLAVALSGIEIDKSKEEQNFNISLDLDENSEEYQKFYFEMERYLNENCEALKLKMKTSDVESEKSYSKNPEAIEYFLKGNSLVQKEKYNKAIKLYKKAVELDNQFAFAYDNLGLCYRNIKEYDNALIAYRKSLQIDPNGMMPLQNIAIVYLYKKEYTEAINSYKKLTKLDENNPEIYYGIGQIYSYYLNEYEKGLENMCKAYNLYVAHKSPYRSDAEQIINFLYGKMKDIGQESAFDKILEENSISPLK